MKVETSTLQSAVTRAIRGAGNNKLLPVTSLMEIRVSENVLVLTTTDASNYFSVTVRGVESDDFAVSVNADMFTKLVQKMTSEYISIEALDNYMMVVGNGKYKLDLLLDETGKPVTFMKIDDSESTSAGTIQMSSIKAILANNKASLSADSTVACLTNYYCSDGFVLTTDRYKVCKLDGNIFGGDTYLISPVAMELLSVFTSDEISYRINNSCIQFDSENEFLYTPIVEGADKMPVQVLSQLLDTNLPYFCEIGRDSLLSVLDRLSLFVSPYDKNVIYLTFTDSALEITSKKSSGVETIPYTGESSASRFTCAIDIEMFRSQVASCNGANVKLCYGIESAIRFDADGVKKVVALQEDDRVA